MMSQSIFELVQVLADPKADFPSNRLSEFSDLDSSQVAILRREWNTIPTERRRRIMEELGKLADDHFELLLEETYKVGLDDEDVLVRVRAIQNLWECEDSSLVPYLVEELEKNSSSEIRAVAAEALGKYALRNELTTLPDDLGAEISAALTSSANNDPNPGVRRTAIESLGNTTSDQSREVIEEAYQSERESFRIAAIVAMGRSADDRWGETLLAELSSPDPSIRAAAARSCGEIEYKPSIIAIVELVEDSDGAVSRAAIWALGQIGGQRSRRTIIDLLENEKGPAEIEILEDALDHLVFADSTKEIFSLDLDTSEDRGH